MGVTQYTPAGDFGPGKLQWVLILLIPIFAAVESFTTGDPGFVFAFAIQIVFLYLLAIGYNRIRK